MAVQLWALRLPGSFATSKRRWRFKRSITTGDKHLRSEAVPAITFIGRERDRMEQLSGDDKSGDS